MSLPCQILPICYIKLAIHESVLGVPQIGNPSAAPPCFAAEFRLPRSLSKSKKKARVHTFIDQLGLCSAASTVIGDESHRGVSGGERRRLPISIDIIHDPIFLFLGEPTSGLNSSR